MWNTKWNQTPESVRNKIFIEISFFWELFSTSIIAKPATVLLSRHVAMRNKHRTNLQQCEKMKMENERVRALLAKKREMAAKVAA